MQMIRNTEILLIITIHQTSQSSRKSVRNVHCKDWCWGWSSNTLATWCKELTNLKKHWYWERLKAGGEGNDRGWDAWMASPTPWTWVWASSESWWWTGKPGMLQSMNWTWLRDWSDWLIYQSLYAKYYLKHISCINSFIPQVTNWTRYYYCPHFTNEKTGEKG